MKSSNDPRVHYSMDLLRGALYKLHKVLVLLYIVLTESAPVCAASNRIFSPISICISDFWNIGC